MVGMKLFRLRPKIHFQQHITMLLNLGDVGFSALSYLGSMRHLFRFIHIVLGCLGTPLLFFLYIVTQGDIWHNSDFSCWSDEDYIGRVSRLGRTCHPRTCALRCLEKALVLYSIQFKSFRWNSEGFCGENDWVPSLPEGELVLNRLVVDQHPRMNSSFMYLSIHPSILRISSTFQARAVWRDWVCDH